jgi:hypothetical protein
MLIHGFLPACLCWIVARQASGWEGKRSWLDYELALYDKSSGANPLRSASFLSREYCWVVLVPSTWLSEWRSHVSTVRLLTWIFPLPTQFESLLSCWVILHKTISLMPTVDYRYLRMPTGAYRHPSTRCLLYGTFLMLPGSNSIIDTGLLPVF